jgi:hypothetical protein
MMILSVHASAARELETYFPAVASGGVPAQPQSGWRISYDLRRAPNQTTCVDNAEDYGCSDVFEIRSASFMRRDASGSMEWTKVINRLALSEILVVYNDGNSFFDIIGNKSELVAMTEADVAGPGAITREVHDNRVVAEVTDDHVRWAQAASSGVRRGQTFDLWCTLRAGGYRYVLRYQFADDGTIRVRAGATGHNQHKPDVTEDVSVHVHMPIWRVEFDLGGADATAVHVMERVPDATRVKARTVDRPFNGGREGGERWLPEAFTSVMVVNHQTLNRRRLPLSYKFVPVKGGNLRTQFEQTRNDFWVTRVTPDDPIRAAGPELRYWDIHNYTAAPETLQDRAVAIWYSAPFQHVPRSEDFIANDANPLEGLTLTMWSGFDLVPHNLWDQTPFLPAR